MRKILMVAMIAAVVAVPAALADATPQAPGAYCVAHPDQIGTGKLYPTMKACVKAQKAQSDQNLVNAAKACLAEKDDANFAASHGGKTFDQFYATNGANGKGKSDSGGNGNAFGKCVSSKAYAKTAAQQTAQTNAAKKCRTPEMKALTGAGKQYKNFGACVSAQAKLAQS
jgi:opacity protein-like surface antigen